jgi:hypothetical protein
MIEEQTVEHVYLAPQFIYKDHRMGAWNRALSAQEENSFFKHWPRNALFHQNRQTQDLYWLPLVGLSNT